MKKAPMITLIIKKTKNVESKSSTIKSTCQAIVLRVFSFAHLFFFLLHMKKNN